jgi:mono/diheme cytochrome c family protein
MTTKLKVAALGALAVGLLGFGVNRWVRPSPAAAAPPTQAVAHQGYLKEAAVRTANGRGLRATVEGLYRRQCLTCHGADGSARGVRGGTPAIPDFTRAAWQASRTDAHLLAGILNGRGDEMPAFDDVLDPEQARAMVAYVRAFGPATATPAALTPAPAANFTTDFRKLQEEWDELEKQYQQLARPRRKP